MSEMSLGERAVHLALRCYPRWWRDRYGPDQEALVEDLMAEQSRSAWLAAADWALAGSFFLGAVRARWTGFGMPAVPELWQLRARAAIVAGILLGALAAPVAGLMLGITEYATGSDRPGPIRLSAAGEAMQWESPLLDALMLAFLIRLAWAAAELSSEMRALAPPRRRLLVSGLTRVPVVAVGLGFVLLIAAGRLRPVISGGWGNGHHVTHVIYSYPGHPLAATVLFGAGLTGILGGWCGGAVLLATMAARRHFPLRALIGGVRQVRAVTRIQGGVALCAAALAVTLPLQPPIGPNGGMIYRSDLGPWRPLLTAALIGVALIMWVTTRAALQAVNRAISLAGTRTDST
jgi:hypothetical protein